MALITCPECKKKISETADSCPNCGNKLTPEQLEEIKKKEKKAQKDKGIGCLVIIIFVGLFYYLTTSGDNNTKTNEVVQNSEWDGSVYQVKAWLKTNLKDPDSLDIIDWSKVIETDTGYKVRVKYRAKNSFGGFVIENKLFFLDKNGNITNVINFE